MQLRRISAQRISIGFCVLTQQNVNCKPFSLLNIKADSYTLSNTSFFVEFGLGITVVVIAKETIYE